MARLGEVVRFGRAEVTLKKCSPSQGTLEQNEELLAERKGQRWLPKEGMSFNSQRALLMTVHSSLEQVGAWGGRE